MTRRYIANKFLSPDVIDASIDEVHRLAENDDQKIALAGGIAMQIYGSDRLTGDIDIIAETALPGIKREGELAIIPGYSGRLPNGVAVDVIVPEPGHEWHDLFEHALVRAVAHFRGGIPVVTREDMIALKMMANREEKDLGDLYFLITDEHTDLVVARRIVSAELGKYAAKEFDALVEEATWAMSQRKGKRR